MKRFAVPAWIVPAGALILAVIAVPRADGGPPGFTGDPVSAAVAEAVASAGASRPGPDGAPPAEELPPLGSPRLDPVLGRYVAPLGQGRAVLTLDPALQARLERSLASYAVPWGATVLLEPATGRILAMAEHSRAEPGRSGLALSALAPAASIFKLVTAAALLERGVSPADQVCFHGGRHRLQPRLLADDPRRDRRCLTLEAAFGHSANVAFAKLAGRGLDAQLLRAVASRFLFDAEIPFVRKVEISSARIEEEPFALASTAAGFGPVRLSPLHGALLAAIVANGGVFVPPALVEEAEGAPAPEPPAPWRVVDEQVAGALQEMMRATVTEGTARRTFLRARGPLRGVAVAGKTGSLSEASPYRDYSWFVGYAPAHRPEVAIATVVVNERLWRVRAPTLAREALEAYFANPVARIGGGRQPHRTAHAAAP
jgi:cell division protein FtsI/penicillin-binding protein 2